MVKLAQRKSQSHIKKVAKKTLHKKEPIIIKNHKKALKDGWNQLKQTPVSTFITCFVIAMTILLTSTLFLALTTFKHVAQSLNASNQVTVYLKSATQEEEIQAWIKELQHTPLLTNVTYISPEQALAELTQETDFNGILTNITENPLPPVLLLRFANQDKQIMTNFVQTLKANSMVDSIHLNFEWFERLFAILNLGNRLTYLLTFLFSIGVIFIVSHTIQGATSKNHQEMTLLQLIGASLAYVRRPFLYLGTLLGIGAGLLAVCLLWLLFLALKEPLNTLLQSYNLQPISLLCGLQTLCAILACSSFLGWLGSWIAFYKYTKLYHN